MSFFREDQIEELATFASWADKEARSDLAWEFIKDENDYTSMLTGTLRRMIRSHSVTGLTVTSCRVPPKDERLLGVDASIVLTAGKMSKVAVFEAKWPRFKLPDFRWDYPQTASGLSHFSDQLIRQSQGTSDLAIFEVFYSEYPPGEQRPFLQIDGSSCVWHDEANQFRQQRSKPDDVWSQSELVSLLKRHCHSIGDILRTICHCRRGQPVEKSLEEITDVFSLPETTLFIEGSPPERTREVPRVSPDEIRERLKQRSGVKLG